MKEVTRYEARMCSHELNKLSSLLDQLIQEEVSPREVVDYARELVSKGYDLGKRRRAKGEEE